MPALCKQGTAPATPCDRQLGAKRLSPPRHRTGRSQPTGCTQLAATAHGPGLYRPLLPCPPDRPAHPGMGADSRGPGSGKIAAWHSHHARLPALGWPLSSLADADGHADKALPAGRKTRGQGGAVRRLPCRTAACLVMARHQWAQAFLQAAPFQTHARADHGPR